MASCWQQLLRLCGYAFGSEMWSLSKQPWTTFTIVADVHKPAGLRKCACLHVLHATHLMRKLRQHIMTTVHSIHGSDYASGSTRVGNTHMKTLWSEKNWGVSFVHWMALGQQLDPNPNLKTSPTPHPNGCGLKPKVTPFGKDSTHPASRSTSKAGCSTGALDPMGESS